MTLKRSELLKKYKWKTTDIFSTDKDWYKEKEDLIEKFNDILQYRGRLSSSASMLLECLELNSTIERRLGSLYGYACCRSDEDLRNSKYIGMKQEIEQAMIEYSSISSFIEPEIAQMSRNLIDGFIKEDPSLKKYSMKLFDIYRLKPHKLSTGEEKILARAKMLADSPYSIFSIFSNAELPYPEVKLKEGKKVLLDQSGYAKYRSSPDRRDRETVFKKFWGVINKFKGTLGAKLYASVKGDVFFSICRGYDSSLKASLDVNNIPEEIYHNLIKNINKNLDTFHRYLLLRKRLLNVERLEYWDIYAPAVVELDFKFSIDEGWDIIEDSLSCLGPEYLSVLKMARGGRWVDVFPSPGKRSGAYSNGAIYDVHPFILLNYNEDYKDVTTLAHELGHAIHSYFSNKNQPFATAFYPIFIAEVSSIINELLLTRTMIQRAGKDDVKLSLLVEYLDGFKGTLFRQTKFAEFELLIHEMVERGDTLTGDNLTSIYGNLLRKYYGHVKGICHIDDLFMTEWANIPHFYMNFYVYQYGVSFTAAVVMAESIMRGEQGVVERYLHFLSAGGSDYPIEILKRAGVDLTSNQPFERAIESMNSAMDEIESLIG